MFHDTFLGLSALPWFAAENTVRVGDVESWDQRWRPLQTSTTLDSHQATFYLFDAAARAATRSRRLGS